MSLEEHNANNNKSNKDQLILNISYNPDTGKLILSDNFNNHYSCNLFGRIKTQFIPNITGRASHTQRQHYLSNHIINQKKEILNRPKTSKQLFLNRKGPVDYHPTTRKFEGYSKFPRPLSPPFYNIPDYEMKEAIKKELIQNLEKYFSEKNTKNIILNNNCNPGLSYLTKDLNEFNCIKMENDKILKLINNTLDSIKEKNKLQLNKLKKIPIVKALSQFKNFLLAYDETSNKKLPNSQIKKRYNYIQSAISRHGLKKKNNIKNKNFLTINNDFNINQFNKNLNFRTLTLDSNKNNYNKFNEINNNNVLKNIFHNKNFDFKLGKKIYMDFGTFSYEEEKKNQNVALTQENNKYKEKEITEATKETEESYNLDKNKIIIKNKKIDENLSLISDPSENDNNKKEKNKALKGLKYMQNIFNKEKILLKGFQGEERKGFIYLFKNIRPKLKNNGELYEEDLELLRKTNPIAFKIQKQKEEFDMKQLIKKVNNLRINSDNIMKGKKLKIINNMDI